jgi:Mrp family chromosome partitioning ATPase
MIASTSRACTSRRSSSSCRVSTASETTVGDTLRSGSKGGIGPVKPGGGTDPDAAASDQTPPPQGPTASLIPVVAPLTASRPIDLGAGLVLNPDAPRSMHEDLTSMRPPATRPIQRVNSTAPPTVRAELAVPIEGAERPKVWVATHKAPPDPDPRLILIREPDSARAASFRVLRHRLADCGDPRVIAVTSPEPRDGKTTCAANLALALSEFGRAKVLLVEANFRNPQLAVLFGFLPPECFSMQLQRHRERPLDPWSVVEAFSPALHVLAVKPGETNRPLLDAPALAIAVEMLARAGYDFIVFDTPPVLGSADVNLIEDYVDAFILAARSGRTQGRALRAAVEQLSPRKLLGIALIDA